MGRSLGIIAAAILGIGGALFAQGGKPGGSRPVTVLQASPSPAAADATSGTAVGGTPDFRANRAGGASPSEAFRSPIFRTAIVDWLSRLQPNQGGVIWLAAIVTIVVAFDFQRPFRRRNLDILLLLVLSLLFVDIIRFSVIREPAKLTLSGFVFLGVFGLSILLAARGATGAFAKDDTPWRPNLGERCLVGLVLLLLVCNVLLVLQRYPDDCGNSANRGAWRMIETGKLPYGDPAMRSGSATYGPLLYLSHIPVQLVLSRFGVTGAHGGPPVLATKLVVLIFHLLAVLSLVVIGRRLAAPAVGWSLACLYVGSPYVLGLGGEGFFISGLTFISHIAPAAVTLAAFALLDQPLRAGMLLAAGAGLMFYPAFFFPLWFGYYFWRRAGWKRFAAGFLVVCLAVAGGTIALTRAAQGESALNTIYQSTVGNQEGKSGYGSSTFSFWGTHPRVASFWQEPLIAGWHLLRPTSFVFLIFLGATFFMARGRKPGQLALLTASIAIAAQLLVKTHAGGTYVEWYLPFFLIGLCVGRQAGEAGAAGGVPRDAASVLVPETARR